MMHLNRLTHTSTPQAGNIAEEKQRMCVFLSFLSFLQVGTGDRSEKIKTYNYKDSRCSDHRLKQNYDLNKQLDGEIEDNIQVSAEKWPMWMAFLGVGWGGGAWDVQAGGGRERGKGCSDQRLKQNYDLNKQLDGEIEDNIQVSADKRPMWVVWGGGRKGEGVV
jgi:hypothetical protein